MFPFFGLRALQSDFDFPATPFGQGMLEPQAHAHETERSVLIEIDLPRFRKGDVDVQADANTGAVRVVGDRPPQVRDDMQLLFGHTEVTHFHRTFYLSPEYYDMAKTEYTLEDGVLTIKVPKREAPPKIEHKAPVTLFDGRAAAIKEKGEGAKGEGTVAKAQQGGGSLEQVRKLSRTRWPPSTKVDESENALSYTFELPEGVARDNLKLTLDGRRLTLQVHCEGKSAAEQRSVTYSQSLMMPQGTKAEDIHTSYEEGKLKVEVQKAGPEPGSPKASQDVNVRSK